MQLQIAFQQTADHLHLTTTIQSRWSIRRRTAHNFWIIIIWVLSLRCRALAWVINLQAPQLVREIFSSSHMPTGRRISRETSWWVVKSKVEIKIWGREVAITLFRMKWQGIVSKSTRSHASNLKIRNLRLILASRNLIQRLSFRKGISWRGRQVADRASRMMIWGLWMSTSS